MACHEGPFHTAGIDLADVRQLRLPESTRLREHAWYQRIFYRAIPVRELKTHTVVQQTGFESAFDFGGDFGRQVLIAEEPRRQQAGTERRDEGRERGELVEGTRLATGLPERGAQTQRGDGVAPAGAIGRNDRERDLGIEDTGGRRAERRRSRNDRQWSRTPSSASLSGSARSNRRSPWSGTFHRS